MSRNDIINTDGTIKWDVIGGFNEQLASIAPQLLTKYDSHKVAVSGGYDWQPAIQQAINDANTNLGNNPYVIVFVPVGTYDYYNTIEVKPNVVLVGTWGSTFNAKSDNNAFYFDNNSGSYNISYVNTFSTTRKSGTSNHILVNQGDSVWLEKNRINGSAATGVFNTGASNGKIINNLVINTLADGYHNTRGTNNMHYDGNIAQNTGDDGFAVVSYQSDGQLCHDIDFKDCYVLNSKARGIAIVGGQTIRVHFAKIISTMSAGVYVAYESSYNTYGVDKVELMDIEIWNANTYNSPSIQMGGLHITSNNASYLVQNVFARNIRIYNSAWRGVSLGSTGSTPYLQNITLEDILVDTNNADSGFVYGNITNLTVRRVTVRNSFKAPFYDNAGNSGSFIFEQIKVDNPNTSKTATIYGFIMRSQIDYYRLDMYEVIDKSNNLSQTLYVNATLQNVDIGVRKYVGTTMETTSNLLSLAPSRIGQLFVSGGIAYMATGISASTDWKQISN